MDDNWYARAMRSGWLGSGPQATQEADDRIQKGASGTRDYSKYDASAYGEALKNVSKKVSQKPDEGA